MTRLILFLYINFLSSPTVVLEDLLLGINLNDPALYHQLSRSNDFKLSTDDSTFIHEGLIQARYLGKSDLYAFADSIHLKIWSTMAFRSPDNQGHYSDIRSGRQIKLFIYQANSAVLDSNYQVLKDNMAEALRRKDPNWKNHKGAREGTFFVTENMFPILSVYKDTRKYPHLVVEMDNMGH